MEQARLVTPAEMRERCAVLAEEEARAQRNGGAINALRRVAAAIRALPLAEEAPTPREKLRRVREARELLATARVAFVPSGGLWIVIDEASGRPIGGWMSDDPWVGLPEKPTHFKSMPGTRAAERRAWVLDTLRAEGWDVVEEGEGDG